MDKRDYNFFQLYERNRVKDALAFYKYRREEFKKAQDQAAILNTIIMALASLASVLGITNVGGLQILWGVLTALLPALAAAILGYARLYEFQERAASSQSATQALYYTRDKFFNLSVAPHESNFRSDLKNIVNEVEKIIDEEGQRSYKSKNSLQKD